MTAAEITDKLGLNQLRGRNVSVRRLSAISYLVFFSLL